MALEKQAKEGMTVKQKGVIGAIIFIVLIIAWQIMGLMSDRTSGPTIPTKSSINQGAANKMTSDSAGANAVPVNNNQMMQQSQLRQAPVMADARFLQLQQMSEQKYIAKINDLEDLKIQREIAETNQAIAAAKLATVTAEKNISDLLTKPAAPAPEIPQASYANKLTHPVFPGESVGAESGAAPPVQVTPPVEYSVISVSMQLGKWSAVMGYKGKLYNVIVGDILPEDDSVVMSINKSGVVLKKEDKTRKISIMLAI
ncbi:MAG: hypothetical protein K0S27_633 [Gammaproteobacteria bacterium]|jgi:hypothetical protein|nr:hypothetical protein [Gammaproteobacteria bacterium]